MKTFNWTQIDKIEGFPDDVIGRFCYYTRKKPNTKVTRICLISYVLRDEIEAHKTNVEQTRRGVVEGGAWEPIENAVWSFKNNRWTIDESQIRKVG